MEVIYTMWAALVLLFIVVQRAIRAREGKAVRRDESCGGLNVRLTGATLMLWDKNSLRCIVPVVIAMALMFFLPVYSHSEEQVVKAGDEAAVNFTCRLPSGDIAASSYPSVAADTTLKKSIIFWRRAKNESLTVTAGSPSGPDPAGRSLEDEILYRLAGPIVGLRAGEKKTVEIKADPRPEKTKDEYVQKVARVRQRVKEMRFTPGQYTARTGNAPEIGQPIIIDPAVPGKVASVTDKEVLIKFTPVGSKVPTPFGEGTVKELPDRYEIAIDAHPDALVRSGGYVGRITGVDDKSITIDYSQPFGGEKLICDVLVESVTSSHPDTK